MDYVVAIPSYKRADLLVKNTLKTLIDGKVPPKKIYIFVANKEEEKEYLRVVPKNMYFKIVVGVLVLRNQRNFITKYFPENKLLVELDDDVKKVLKLVPGNGATREQKQKNNKLVQLKDLNTFFINAFNKLKNNPKKPYLWGVYPVNNPFFLTDKVTDDLRFIVGPMWGKINRHDDKLQLKLKEKEDAERTLRHYKKDGSVLRFNNITIDTTFYITPGGYQASSMDRYKEAEHDANYLVKHFPLLVTKYYKGATRRPEVRFKDKSISGKNNTKKHTKTEKSKKSRKKTKKN